MGCKKKKNKDFFLNQPECTLAAIQVVLLKDAAKFKCSSSTICIQLKEEIPEYELQLTVVLHNITPGVFLGVCHMQKTFFFLVFRWSGFISCPFISPFLDLSVK